MFLILLIVLCGPRITIIISVLLLRLNRLLLLLLLLEELLIILILFLSAVLLILLYLSIALASCIAPVDKSVSIGCHFRLLLLVYILLLLLWCFKVPARSDIFFLLGLLQLPNTRSKETLLLLLEAIFEDVLRLLCSWLVTIEYL